MKAVAAIAVLLAAAPAGAAQRFAVIAGNDEGGQGRARLWYAERDADRMAAAVRELGDFSSKNVVVLRGYSDDPEGPQPLRSDARTERLRNARGLLVLRAALTVAALAA